MSQGDFYDVSKGQKIKIASNLKLTNNLSSYTLYIWINGHDYDNPLDMGNQFFKFILSADASNNVDLKGKDLVNKDLPTISLNNSLVDDDNYLFTGDEFYLNPYDLTVQCNKENSVDNANSNDNTCMKWHEISEDDEYITLMLNSNLGEPIREGNNITNEANTYLKSLTDGWDSQLSFEDGYVVDNYNYSGYKARIISLDEIEKVAENPNWTPTNTKVSNTNLKKYFAWMFTNLDGITWKHGGYFTSTNKDENKNFVFNIYGVDYSVADKYTNGVRPVIMVKKDKLKLSRDMKFSNNDTTYLMTEMITSSSNSTIENLTYNVKNLRAAGIKKAYLDVGYIELASTNGVISVVDKLNPILTDYESNIARFIKIGAEYGVDIVPWINYPMKSDYISSPYSDLQTWGEHVIQMFETYVDKILTDGFTCVDDGKKYYPTEIHLDAEPTRKSYQDYYLKLVSSLSDVINNRSNFSVVAPAVKRYSRDYIQQLSNYVNSFSIIIYDSMGPLEWGDVANDKKSYLAYIKSTISHYGDALRGYKTKFYGVGAMYQDTKNNSTPGWPDASTNIVNTHLNIYNGEEVETLNNFIEAVSSLNTPNLEGIGFYYWDSFAFFDSKFSNGDYISDNYNYKTIRSNFLKNWAYN